MFTVLSKLCKVFNILKFYIFQFWHFQHNLCASTLVVPSLNIDEMRTGSKFEPRRASYEIIAEIGIRLVKLWPKEHEFFTMSFYNQSILFQTKSKKQIKQI